MKPSEDAEVLQSYSRGSMIRVSDESRQGWYKIHIPGPEGGSYGWIKADDLKPSRLMKDLEAAGIQASTAESEGGTQGNFSLGLYGGMALLFRATELQEYAGLDDESATPIGIGAEVGYRPNSELSLLATYRSHSMSELLNSGEKLELSYSRLGLLVDKVFLTSMDFKVCAALGGGLGLGAEATVGADDAEDSLSADGSPYAEARVSARWYPVRGLALTLSGGYAFFFGDSEFEQELGGKSQVSLSSALVEGGLLLEF
ncbi:MAG: SH3 domain-containing protein [Bdellovibrionales bacterium]|nr:SH3 domain-containing protein [Bdellovibrionales bacterium]